MRKLGQALRSFAGRRSPWRVPVDLAQRVAWFVCRRLFGPRSFELGGRRYDYFVHPYVLDNERAVEIAIALDEIDSAIEAARRAGRHLRILEVGNVLSSYADLVARGAAGGLEAGPAAVAEHVVVDKYERAGGVLNVDIVDFWPDKPFDLVISLSTLEHVGIDETPRDDGKALRAFDHLRALLAVGGQGLVTIPVGYHRRLDQALGDGELLADRVEGLARTGRFYNGWRENSLLQTLDRGYGSPYPCANGVVVVRFSRGGN